MAKILWDSGRSVNAPWHRGGWSQPGGVGSWGVPSGNVPKNRAASQGQDKSTTCKFPWSQRRVISVCGQPKDRHAEAPVSACRWTPSRCSCIRRPRAAALTTQTTLESCVLAPRGRHTRDGPTTPLPLCSLTVLRAGLHPEPWTRRPRVRPRAGTCLGDVDFNAVMPRSPERSPGTEDLRSLPYRTGRALRGHGRSGLGLHPRQWGGRRRRTPGEVRNPPRPEPGPGQGFRGATASG